jgi:hypothetical protein
MPKRIDLPGDNSAEIKTSWDVTRRERRDLFKTFQSDDEVDSDAAALQLMILSWSFPDAITTESIDNLPVPVVNALMKETVQFVRELSPDFSPDGGVDDPKVRTAKRAPSKP